MVVTEDDDGTTIQTLGNEDGYEYSKQFLDEKICGKERERDGLREIEEAVGEAKGDGKRDGERYHEKDIRQKKKRLKGKKLR